MENYQLKGAPEVHTSLILQRQELNPEKEIRPLPLELTGCLQTGESRCSGVQCSRGVSINSHPIRT